MKSTLQNLARPLARLVRSDVTVYDGSMIPAKHLRFGGSNFADDAAFVATGERETKRLIDHFDLDEGSSVLEIGCGTGRLPIGILRTIGDEITYQGIDVSRTAVNWCKRYIESKHPSFRFQHINMQNARYNPAGELEQSLKLPLDDASFDIIYLYSVFSHLETDDVKAYLSEFSRLLKPDGKIFLTAFLEEHVPEMSVNPEGYRTLWKGALHCVRFDKAFFEKLLADHGLKIDEFHYETETDGQSALYIKHR